MRGAHGVCNGRWGVGYALLRRDVRRRAAMKKAAGSGGLHRGAATGVQMRASAVVWRACFPAAARHAGASGRVWHTEEAGAIDA
jgi:hypothetical protein